MIIYILCLFNIIDSLEAYVMDEVKWNKGALKMWYADDSVVVSLFLASNIGFASSMRLVPTLDIIQILIKTF